MKFILEKFKIGDRVVMANNEYGEPRPDVGTAGVICGIIDRRSVTRPGEVLYQIKWKSGYYEFYWNIAESALVLEKDWKGKKK